MKLPRSDPPPYAHLFQEFADFTDGDNLNTAEAIPSAPGDEDASNLNNLSCHLSDEDMALVADVHCQIFTSMADCDWYRRSRSPQKARERLDVAQPILLAYSTLARTLDDKMEALG